MKQNQDYTCSSKSQEETADLWISYHTLIHVSRHICFSTDKCHLWRKNDIDTCIWLTRLPTILEVMIWKNNNKNKNIVNIRPANYVFGTKFGLRHT